VEASMSFDRQPPADEDVTTGAEGRPVEPPD
jgi:hypothetical protein